MTGDEEKGRAIQGFRILDDLPECLITDTWMRVSRKLGGGQHCFVFVQSFFKSISLKMI